MTVCCGVITLGRLLVIQGKFMTRCGGSGGGGRVCICMGFSIFISPSQFVSVLLIPPASTSTYVLQRKQREGRLGSLLLSSTVDDFLD